MNLLIKTKELQSSIIRKLMKDNKSSITLTQGLIIRYLATNENVYQRDIENLLKLRRSTISGILHTMEKNDLINKTDNYKLKKITLTENGLNLYKTIDLKFKLFNDEICKGISKEELKLFSDIVDKMIENMNL